MKIKERIFKEVKENITSGQLLIYLPTKHFQKGDTVLVRKATNNEKELNKLYNGKYKRID